MNKFTLLALVATAFAVPDRCATTEELNDADFAKYKLKYMLTKDYRDNNDLTKRISIGFDIKDKTCGKDCWNIKTQSEASTTFKIKGSGVSAGFRIYSEDKKQVLSLNQDKGGWGYYMYDEKPAYVDGNYSYYTLMNYNDADKRLSQASSGQVQYSLGVNDSGNKTHIFRTGTIMGAYETKFCFVKVRILDGAKNLLNYFINSTKEISTDIAKENMETLKEAYPTYHSALSAEGPETLTEKVQKLALESAKKELNTQLEKAIRDGQDKLKEQLELKKKHLELPKTKQEAIDMWNSLQGEGKEEKGDKKDEETEEEKKAKRKDKKDRKNDEEEKEEQKPKKVEDKEPKKDVRDSELAKGDKEDQKPKKGEDKKPKKDVRDSELAKGIIPPGSSVQTPFALSTLILLLLVH